MDINKKIGQLIVAGFDGFVVNDHIRNLITRYHVGNIILFEKNCQSPEQVFKLVQDLQALSLEHNGVPLFVTIDQENGIVNRIYDGVTNFPGNMAQTAGATLEESEKIAEYTGVGLKALGINFNLAPSLDVNNNPKNPVIGNRSFSDAADVVAERAVYAARGYEKAGVIATAKHFPGHGDTELDSHLALPTVSHSRDRLDAVELLPFKTAIESGIPAIMSAHIVFPALDDSGVPATLSKKILTDLLRNELGFNGVLMTDCMEMKAIENLYGTVKSTPIAIKAGADLICLSHTEATQIAAIEEVKALLATDPDLQARVEAAADRVVALKERYGIAEFLTTSYDDARKSLYQPDYEQLADKVSKASIVVNDGDDCLPITDKKVLVISPDGRALTGADGLRQIPNFATYLATRAQNCTAIKIANAPTDDDIMQIVDQLDAFELVVIGTHNALFVPEQEQLVNAIIEKDKKIILIPLRNPHDQHLFPMVKTVIIPHEYTVRSMETVADILLAGN